MTQADIFANLHQPFSILMLFVAAVCFLGYGFAGYKARATDGFLWIVFFIIGLLALIEWVILVFAGGTA